MMTAGGDGRGEGLGDGPTNDAGELTPSRGDGIEIGVVERDNREERSMEQTKAYKHTMPDIHCLPIVLVRVS